jgi:hypothetical protein
MTTRHRTSPAGRIFAMLGDPVVTNDQFRSREQGLGKIIDFSCDFKWWAHKDSNLGPAD